MPGSAKNTNNKKLAVFHPKPLAKAFLSQIRLVKGEF